MSQDLGLHRAEKTCQQNIIAARCRMQMADPHETLTIAGCRPVFWYMSMTNICGCVQTATTPASAKILDVRTASDLVGRRCAPNLPFYNG